MKVREEEHILELLPFHKSIDNFDYTIARDWALKQMHLGKDTDNILYSCFIF